MRRFRLLAPLVLLAALPACTGASPSLMDSAFPTARLGPEGRLAGVDSQGFTTLRVLGRPDGLQPLGEDTTINLRESDGRTLRDLLDVDGRRPNMFDQMRAPDDPASIPPVPRTRGSSSPPPQASLPEVQQRPLATPPPPPPAPQAERTLPPGTTIPGPQGGTVAGGSAGRVGTTVGPSGQVGTSVRDGNTVTLFGPDGSIRTVPVPPR